MGGSRSRTQRRRCSVCQGERMSAMSLQTQHDPKNEAEITTGIALAAAVGLNAKNLRTLSSVRSCKQRWSERSCDRASVLSISAAAAPARAGSRSPSALALPGRWWALTFQRRCWLAVPSGCHRAPRSNSYPPTRRPTGLNRPLSISFFRALASCFSRSQRTLLPICARR